jgi:hypothetical protein
MKMEGIILTEEYLLENLKDCSSMKICIEQVLKYYSNYPISNEKLSIWGDKTPSYLKEMILLKKHFPDSKFIHVIRDPRNVALSFYKTWGKSLSGSAHKWNFYITKSTKTKSDLGADYMEIYYEYLIEHPNIVLKQVCEFIGCEFNENMLTLNKPSEKFGSAKGLLKIKSNNNKNYLNQLSTEQIKKIEGICYSQLLKHNYKVSYAEEQVNLKFFQIFFFKIFDFLQYFRHIIFKEFSFIHGLKFILKSIKQ